ncbi:MAG: DUF4340 domain-containing protein [Candidatus Marinimicrobia bacterium]|nr:DUF4340 domain-containing protein [Candidatus Neomarinimicrobiota bacterium]
MKKRTLLILIVLLALLIALPLWRSRQARQAGPTATEFSAAWAARAWDDLAVVALQSGAETLRLARVDGVWGVAQRDQYPADAERLTRAVRRLALLEGGILVPDGTAWLEEYELDDESLAAGRAVEVRCQDAEGQALGVLRLGARRESTTAAEDPFGGRGPVAVRYLLAENTVWLYPESFADWQLDPADWLDKALFTIPADAVVRLEVHGDAAAAPLVFGRAAGEPWTAAALPPEHEIVTGALDSLAGALAHLQFQDVVTGEGPAADLGFDGARQTTFITSAGDQYTVVVGSETGTGQDRYVRFQLALAEPGEATEAEATPVAPDAPAEQTDWPARLAGRTFVLSGWQADRFVPAQDALIKPVPPPEAEPEEQGTTAEPAGGAGE